MQTGNCPLVVPCSVQRGIIINKVTHCNSEKANKRAIGNLEDTQINQEEVVSQHYLILRRGGIGVHLP